MPAELGATDDLSIRGLQRLSLCVYFVGHNPQIALLLSGIVPAMFGFLLLLAVGSQGGSGTMALFLVVDAIGSVCFGVGVAKLRKSDGSVRVGAAIFAGTVCFLLSVVFPFFAGASMFGL